MRVDLKAVIDANVLANFGTCDLLLRLAETPGLLMLCWSEKILRETQRTHLNKLGWPPHLAQSFQCKIRESFPDAMVSGHDHLVASCRNREEDKHVLACARHARAGMILTFNLRDFPAATLEPWGIQALHPQDLLLILHQTDPQSMQRVVCQIAFRRGKSPREHLSDLGQFLPVFANHMLSCIGDEGF